MDRLRLRVEQFRTVEDLALLPILERDQIQRDPEYFLSTAPAKLPHRTERSSGSTGVPVTVFWDWASWLRTLARRERATLTVRRLAGRRNHRATLIAVLPVAMEGISMLRDGTLIPARLRPIQQRLSSLDPPELNIERMNEFRPDVVVAFGSYVDACFRYLEAYPRDFHRPKAIVYASDALPEPTRRRVVEGFGIPVVAGYQAVEAHPIAFGCGRGSSMHVNIDINPVRIVGRSDESLAVDETGDIIVSNLENRASVILNYRIGDLAALLSERCSCGRTLPLLSRIQGRRGDWFELTGGVSIPPQEIEIELTPETEIMRWQLVQVAPDLIRVSLLCRPSCDKEALRLRLEARLVRVFRGLARVETQFVDRFGQSPSGKFHAFVPLSRR
ncbi:MAG: phenylacetate--CoA ligase family protein [Chloroflexi bacterium]|nr:MAG: phenylacetate--CoA ligase family protein [Chloroflexota bacterium]